MSLATGLPIAYRDVAASDLRLGLHVDVRTPLRCHDLERVGWRVSLGILAASHQVVLDRIDGAIPSLTEIVSCDVSATDAGLPPSHVEPLGTGRYRFTATTRRLGPGSFDAAVVDVLDALTAQSDAVAAAYPGHPLAITALSASVAEHDVLWQTWHTYPQTGEIVHTASRVVLPAEQIR